MPVVIGDRMPNQARLPRGVRRRVELAPVTRDERKLMTRIANGDEPWSKYARGSWKKFLTAPEGNPKIMKGFRQYGIATSVLHLAPSVQSGKNVCVFATPGCASACLTTAGHGGIPSSKQLQELALIGGELYVPPNQIQEARVLKTMFFWEDRLAFMRRLAGAINGFVNWARKKRLQAAVRLNGTSDIMWENIPFTYGGRRYRNIMEAFPGVQFYDYTKNPFRLQGRNFPPNYHLTFSVAEPSEQGEEHVQIALNSGMNLAVVFDTGRSGTLPETWAGLPVVDADRHDMRFIDNWEFGIDTPLIAGLRAKGKAVVDESGFVRNAGGPEDEWFSGAYLFEDVQEPVFVMGRAA